ncbi:MAG: 16S rRNA (uracil(1498)-N(3))-methyltransferase [Lachnospiraceae bacterium]
MQHFFVTPQQVKSDYIYVEGTDVNHMQNVLRMKPGEKLEISDGNNQKYLCAIEKFGPQEVVLKMIKKMNSDNELPSNIYLFQGIPKNDKMELIIQKAVELGVYQIIPVETRRTIVKIDDKKAGKKLERWNKISESGAKQSGRNIVPEVTQILSFSKALDYMRQKELEVSLIPYELAEGMADTKRVIEHILPGQSIAVMIGPEGGFEQEEIIQAMDAGMYPITLGKRILRTETAGLSILSVLMYHLEN